MSSQKNDIGNWQGRSHEKISLLRAALTAALVLLLLMSMLFLASCDKLSEKGSSVLKSAGKDVVLKISDDGKPATIILNHTITLGGPGKDSKIETPE
jgi:hypothetical protein